MIVAKARIERSPAQISSTQPGTHITTPPNCWSASGPQPPCLGRRVVPGEHGMAGKGQHCAEQAHMERGQRTGGERMQPRCGRCPISARHSQTAVPNRVTCIAQ